MAKKETMTTRITREELILLERYASREGLNQTQVYDQACDLYLKAYDEHGELPGKMIYDAPQLGENYRGYVLSEIKERFVAIAASQHKATADVLYSMLRYFIEQQHFGPHGFLTCFVPATIVDRCNKEIEERGIDRAQLTEEACQEFVTWHRSKKRPKSWVVEESDFSGQPYEAYIRQDVIESVIKVAKQQQCSPMDVYYQALVHRYQPTMQTDHVLVAGVMLDSFERDLDKYMQAKGLSQNEVMHQACEGLLNWLETYPQDSSWTPPTMTSGVPVRGHVSIELADKIKALPYVQLDTVSLALMHFIHAQQIHTLPMFVDEETEAHQQAQTPGISIVTLLPEQEKLIRMLTVMLDLDNTNEFAVQATRWWLTEHDQHQGPYPYMGRLTSQNSSEDELVSMNLVIDRPLHERISSIKVREKRSLRTIYYNVLIRYLDYVMENSEDLVTLSKLYKNAQK